MIHEKNFPFHEPDDETEIIHVAPSYGRGGTIGKILLILLIIGGLVFGAFKLFELGKGDSYESGVPVVEAIPEPYKVLPENPGGMAIPHIDKEIYGKLKMPIEEPIDAYDQQNSPDFIFDKENGEQYGESTSPADNRNPIEMRLAEQEKRASQAIRLNARGEQISNNNSRIISADSPHKAKRIDVEKVLAKKNTDEIWLQLGSFKSEEEATKAWQDAREKNMDLLKDLTIKVTKSDMKSQGVLYRLQAGSVEDESNAKTLCRKMNERKQSCFYTIYKASND